MDLKVESVFFQIELLFLLLSIAPVAGKDENNNNNKYFLGKIIFNFNDRL